MNIPKNKHVYVVIGMARSGTSALTRALKILGIALGTKLAPAEEKWNPKGFWEDTDIVYKVNRGVLFALNYTWLSVNRIDSLCKDNPMLTSLKQTAIHLLQERFAQHDHWGFKDPRTAKLLPFWQDVFQALSLNEHYIIACRNPLASAYSYQRVSGSDIELGLLLWLMHIIPAIEGTHGKKRIVVSYERMLEDPKAELQRLRDFLGREIDPTELDIYANNFLDANLSHFTYTEEDLSAHPAVAVAPYAVRLYKLLNALAADQIHFDSVEFISEWRAIMQSFEASYPSLCYMDTWIKRHKKIERDLRSIKRSLPWMLTYPLRLIDDLFRKNRRKAREQRRLSKSYG